MAWHKVLAFSLFSSTIAIGCVVGTSDDDGGDDPRLTGGFGGDDDGGASGSGGSAGSTGGSAGSSGSGGSAGMAGGSGGGGGDAGAEFMCTPDDTSLSDCDACVHAKCCQELSDCTDDTCLEEAPCVIECVGNVATDGGFPDQNTVEDCAAQCAQSGVLGVEADALVTCINAPDSSSDAGLSNCSLECFFF